MVLRLVKTPISCEHLLGTFLDESHFDNLFDQDVDIIDANTGEVAVSFRKGCLDSYHSLSPKALKLLKSASKTITYSRNLAAGKKLNTRIGPSGKSGPERATLGEVELLNQLINKHPSEVKFEVLNKTELSVFPWLKPKTTDNFDLKVWAEELRANLVPELWATEAKAIKKKYLASTGRGNGAESGIIGAIEKTSRQPYCRMSYIARNNWETFQECFPLVEQISDIYLQCSPKQHELQRLKAQKTDPRYLIGDSVFSTITVNHNFRTAAHRDPGNYGKSLAPLVTISETGFSGSYLVFPEFRAAVTLQPSDFIVCNNALYIHGNTAAGSLDDERISLVLYLREGLATKCCSYEIEDARQEFVFHLRSQKATHPLSTGNRWQGVYSGMWEKDEWYNYLEEKQGKEAVDFWKEFRIQQKKNK